VNCTLQQRSMAVKTVARYKEIFDKY